MAILLLIYEGHTSQVRHCADLAALRVQPPYPAELLCRNSQAYPEWAYFITLLALYGAENVTEMRVFSAG